MFKPAILGIFFILVFCMNPVTIASTNDNLHKNHQSINLENNYSIKEDIIDEFQPNKQKGGRSQSIPNYELSDHNSLTSTLDYNSLNLSVDDLVSFIRNIYENFQFRDTPKPGVSYHTTVAAMQALSLLKITGLEEYIIPNEITIRTNIIKNFKFISSDGKDCGNIPTSNNKTCGYSINNNLNVPSLSGTFGAVMSIKMLGNPDVILGEIDDFIIRWILNENLVSNSTHVFFSDISSNTDKVSISNIYWAVATLELLNFNFNSSFVQKIDNTLQDLWVTTSGLSHFDDFDRGLSILVKNYYASSLLMILNRTNPTAFNQAFWSEIVTDLPLWISTYQSSEGVNNGGFNNPITSTINVVDTGAALAILNILGNGWNEIDLTASISFLLNSQYKSTTGTNSNVLGGFSLNNESFSLFDAGVNTRNTFYALLGLFASGYFSNTTNMALETTFGRQSGDSDLLNQLIAGQTSTNLFLRVDLSESYSYSNLNMTTVDFPDWNISFVGNRKTGDKFEYEFLLNEDVANNWTWGSHQISSFYKTKNFNLLPKNVFEFQTNIIVGPKFSFSLVNVSSSDIKPGLEISNQIDLDNSTLDPSEAGFLDFGNFSISLYYPNGSFYPVAINSSLIVDKNITTYWFNDTIPDMAPLGEYYLNVSLINNTNIFTRKLVFNLDDTITFRSINGKINTNDEITVYPGSNIDLTLDLSYSNNMIFPDAKAQLFFISYKTGQKIFSTDLIFQNSTFFKTNMSDVYPTELILGDYNLTINFVWKSALNNVGFNSTITNSTLPFISISGQVEVSLENFKPGKVIQLGADINFTTKLIIDAQGIEIPINHNFELRGRIFETGGVEIQSLTYNYLGNGYGQLFGKIKPNLLKSSSYFLEVECMMNSTLDFQIVKNSTNSNYRFDFKIDADLSLDTVTYIQGNSTTNKLDTPVMIIDFTIINKDNNNVSIGSLDLNGLIKHPDGNETLLSNPIVPIEGEDFSSYQIQIPTDNLVVGLYEINLTAINAIEKNLYLGSISFEIIDLNIDNEGLTDFPVEIYIVIVLLIVAIVVTYLRGKLIKD